MRVAKGIRELLRSPCIFIPKTDDELGKKKKILGKDKEALSYGIWNVAALKLWSGPTLLQKIVHFSFLLRIKKVYIWKAQSHGERVKKCLYEALTHALTRRSG